MLRPLALYGKGLEFKVKKLYGFEVLYSERVIGGIKHGSDYGTVLQSDSLLYRLRERHALFNKWLDLFGLGGVYRRHSGVFEQFDVTAFAAERDTVHTAEGTKHHNARTGKKVRA